MAGPLRRGVSSGSPVQGEHNDAREACDEPSLLSHECVTEGLSIAPRNNPSDLAALGHLPLLRGGMARAPPTKTLVFPEKIWYNIF